MKAMTKYQLEHFKTKVKHKFAPMIEEVDLSLRKIVADMTESAEKKLSDKIGATEIIKDLLDAEAEHIKAMKKARTFFTKNITAEQKENLDYKFRKDEKLGFESGYSTTRISAEDCKEQIRSWAQKLAEREAEKTPIGKKKVKLLQLKEDAISDVMESGMPAELIEKLGQRLKVIGIAWNNNVKQIGNNLN
tara:strand:- start:42 stop:614 length:573 start_codon:yes stop_codon:yes gene_type:complete